MREYIENIVYLRLCKKRSKKNWEKSLEKMKKSRHSSLENNRT